MAAAAQQVAVGSGPGSGGSGSNVVGGSIAAALGVNEKELETLFSNKPAAELPAPRDGAGGGGPAAPQLIDMRRANHCEIMLKQIKRPIEDVLRAVHCFDDAALDADTVNGMLKFVPEAVRYITCPLAPFPAAPPRASPHAPPVAPRGRGARRVPHHAGPFSFFCPSQDEALLLKGYKGDVAALGRAERFMLSVLQRPRWGPKLAALQYKLSFPAALARVRGQLETVAALAEEVRRSQTLPPVMQAILSLGNVMNAGTAKGAASGFRLASLDALARTRSGNGKTTLLHYLCKARSPPETRPKPARSLRRGTRALPLTRSRRVRHCSCWMRRCRGCCSGRTSCRTWRRRGGST